MVRSSATRSGIQDQFISKTLQMALVVARCVAHLWEVRLRKRIWWSGQQPNVTGWCVRLGVMPGVFAMMPHCQNIGGVESLSHKRIRYIQTPMNPRRHIKYKVSNTAWKPKACIHSKQYKHAHISVCNMFNSLSQWKTLWGFPYSRSISLKFLKWFLTL